MDTSRLRTWAEIDLDALEHNLNTIRQTLAKSQKLAAVIKANAYGHGAIRIAKFLSGKVDYFAVAMPEEGYELRNAGVADPIMVLGHAPEGQFESMVRHGITATVCDIEEAKLLSELVVFAVGVGNQTAFVKVELSVLGDQLFLYRNGYYVRHEHIVGSQWNNVGDSAFK